MFGFFGSKKTKQEQKESEKSPVSHGVTRDDFTFLPPLPSYFNQANQSTSEFSSINLSTDTIIFCRLD